MENDIVVRRLYSLIRPYYKSASSPDAPAFKTTLVNEEVDTILTSLHFLIRDLSEESTDVKSNS